MQLGIRLHDVNAGLGEEEQTLSSRAKATRKEGFSCVHLALSKVINGITFDASSLTEGLGMHVKRVLSREELDVAVLGCYLNLANPNPEQLKDIQSLYFGNILVASIMGAGVVGTETGAPNEQYQTDANTHTKKALETFIKGLEPVIECAEDYGVTVAIEPVWKHIVYDPDRALEVIKSIQSHNLRIIFDPVNLLCNENVADRDYIFANAIEKLGEFIAVVHLKDFIRKGSDLLSVASGFGEMDYTRILRFMKERKPYIQATLEDTNNDNAVSARMFLEEEYAKL